MPKIIVPIRGMHCRSCEILIERALKKLREVRAVNVSYKEGLAHIYYKEGTPSMQAISQSIQDAGYEVGEKEHLPWISTDFNDYIKLFWAFVILALLYYALRGLGIFDLSVNTSNMSFFVSLLVGLVAGVSTCMALVGGLVLGLSARHAELHPEATIMQKFRPHIYFNIGRILGYAFLGGVIGLIGSAITPSIGFLGFLTIAVGIVMIFLGLKLIEIFPVLRDKTITLPKAVSQYLGINRENREYSHKGAMATGALTFFLPCGFTQAMQLYAVSTGSFWQGAIVMAMFALGTTPGLISIGYLSSIFKGQKARLFFMVTGLAIIFLGGFNIVNGKQLIGGLNPNASITGSVSTESVQEVRMTEDYNGYYPNTFTVEKGRPVKWIIDAKNVYSCATFLVMPKMGINTTLKTGENIITFTPTETGTLYFSCSMGMYRGRFNVVEKGSQAGVSGESGNSSAGGLLASATDSSSSSASSSATDSTSSAPSSVSSASAQPSANSGNFSCGTAGEGCGCAGGNAATNINSASSNTASSAAVAATTTATASAPTASAPATDTSASGAKIIKSEYTNEYGLYPSEFTVKKDQPIKWVISLKAPPAGCMRHIVISELGIFQTQPDSGEMTVSFTPKTAGNLVVTCAMGMYRALIHVI